MTGFARESAEPEIGALTWEIRSVNHRYLDVQFRLPDELRPHEQAFRQRVSAVLSRGKIECALNFRRAFNQGEDLQINTALVELIGTRIKEMSAELPATGAVNPFDVLRWPGVVQQADVDTEPLFDAALELLRASRKCSSRAAPTSMPSRNRCARACPTSLRPRAANSATESTSWTSRPNRRGSRPNWR